MSLRIVPISLDTANEFVFRLHRHNDPLPGNKFSVGVADGDGTLVGVAIVGNPSAPALQKVAGLIEIRRVCTDGTRNACSKLYGAARRAARAMGHAPVITYTLPSEGGASLRAAGFVLEKTDAGGKSADWHNRTGRTVLPIEQDLVGGKWRWVG
ncbi:MAG TPA: XF1762 family protein [Burkholderiaceae bacterium]|nr:XF1762 family protein [Burkholderiaceae bacterium]